MSVREEIQDGREAGILRSGIIYTEVLGWVDMGHARGDDVRKLLSDMHQGEHSGKDYYDVKYTLSMGRGGLTIGKFIRWRIRKGRSLFERYSIALSMMMALAHRFEGLQSNFPFFLYTDSGFSGEDLVSDLLGFYRVFSYSNPFPLLQPVSKEEALRRWDYYGPIGSFKNTSFQPILFPDPMKSALALPVKGVLPSFMRTVIPYSDFSSGNVKIVSRDGTVVNW